MKINKYTYIHVYTIYIFLPGSSKATPQKFCEMIRPGQSFVIIAALGVFQLQRLGTRNGIQVRNNLHNMEGSVCMTLL